MGREEEVLLSLSLPRRVYGFNIKRKNLIKN
jgi:hypothetical protein